MTRYELRCYVCGQILGYMSIEAKDALPVDAHFIDSTALYGEKEPICCPLCEAKRLGGE